MKVNVRGARGEGRGVRLASSRRRWKWNPWRHVMRTEERQGHTRDTNENNEAILWNGKVLGRVQERLKCKDKSQYVGSRCRLVPPIDVLIETSIRTLRPSEKAS